MTDLGTGIYISPENVFSLSLQRMCSPYLSREQIEFRGLVRNDDDVFYLFLQKQKIAYRYTHLGTPASVFIVCS